MVFQSYALYPHMTVYDNLAFGLKLRKVPKADIDKRVQEAAGILDLGKLLARKPKELSGGQRQRVALGRAIVREPAVFLMDEPLSNLDAKLRVQTRAEIARLHQRLKTTMVYVTHDQIEAMTMGTRIAVMSDGLLQQVGTPQALYDTPVNRFVAGFIGSPAMNFVDVALNGTRRRGDARRRRLQAAAPGPDARIGRTHERTPARRRDPARAPRPRHLGPRRCNRPGQGGRRRVPRQRGAPPRHRRGQGARRGRRCRAPGSTGRHPQPRRAARQGPPVRRRVRSLPDRVDPGCHGGLTATRGGTIDPFADPVAEADLRETTVDSRVIHRGRTLTFRVDTIERTDGSRHQREIVGHPGAVAVVALDAEDRVLLVRQFRTAVGRTLLEIPAGTLDVDAATGAVEDPDLAAARELEEETGQRAGSWRKLGEFWTAPGFATELMHLYLATDLRPADTDRLDPDEDEALVAVRVPFAEAVAAAEDGRIADAKSIVGLLRLAGLRTDDRIGGEPA